MQTFIPNITNVAQDIASQGNTSSNASVNEGRSDRDEFARMVDRAAEDRKAPVTSRNALDDIAETRAREARSEDIRNENAKADRQDRDNPRTDNDRTPENKAADKSDAKTDKPEAKSGDARADDTKTDKTAVRKADNDNDDSSDGAKARRADSAAALTANELPDESASDDGLASPVGGSITPDVTAILPDAPSVQAAGDTDLLTASTQPIGLLALAALIEKASAAIEAQKLAASQKASANAASNLTILSSPVSPVVTDDTAAAPTGDVTALVDVLGEQAELPGLVNPQPVALAEKTRTNKADAIINAVRQAAQPVLDPAQMQLTIAAEEVADPADALAKVMNTPEASKVVQQFLGQGEQSQGKRSNEDLLAALKDVLAHRGEKENLLPFGQAVSQAVHASLDLDTNHDNLGVTLGQGNANIMSQLAADTLRHGAAAGRADNAFAAMLDKTTAHVPVHDQVMVNIKQAIADGASHIKIQLHPEELGRVDVRMSVGVDGKTGVTIMADNRETLDMLQREVRNLERALTDLGLKPDAGGLSFHLRQQNQDQKFTRQQTGYASVAEVEADELAPMTNMAAYRLTVNEGVDISV